jgi:hypothetical protein
VVFVLYHLSQASSLLLSFITVQGMVLSNFLNLITWDPVLPGFPLAAFSQVGPERATSGRALKDELWGPWHTVASLRLTAYGISWGLRLGSLCLTQSHPDLLSPATVVRCYTYSAKCCGHTYVEDLGVQGWKVAPLKCGLVSALSDKYSR